MRPIRARPAPVLALAAALAIGVAGCGSTKARSEPPLPPGAAGITGLAAVTTGQCLTWDQAGGAQKQAQVVACSAPHLAEVAAVTSISGFGSSYPGDSALAGFGAQACPAKVTAYLGHAVDPDGPVTTSALYPSAIDWQRGNRGLVCDLVHRASGAGGTLTAFTGTAAQAEQAPLFAVGTCLVEVGAGAHAVPCAETHEVEVTGDARSPAGPKAAEPTNQQQWQTQVGDSCGRAAQAYLGGSLYLGVASGWLPPSAASWAAGRRQVTCLIGRQLDDGGWEPTTGTLHHAGTQPTG